MKTLDEHAAVADEPCVGFRAHLLAAGTAADETMKSADRAAGDGDEQERGNGGGELAEDCGDNQTEYREDDAEREEENEQEQKADAAIEKATGNIAHGLSLIAQTDPTLRDCPAAVTM